MKHAILVVDDEIDNVEALERLFRKKYTVFKATSGREALAILERQKISLILTDQRMPGMTGVELLSESMDSNPEAVRILLTGYTDVESVIAAINSGQVYRYVTKPWDPVDLTNAVDKAIERFEMSAELKDKNERLSTALAELRTLDEAKSNFMILINHELKTPLTVMVSFLGLLQESKLDDEQKKFVARISQSADRLQAMVNDSLELVSAETGTMPIKVTGINLKKLLKELSPAFQAQMDAKSMALDVSLESEDVRADAKALKSIVTRLMDNAVKFGFDKSSIEFTAREVEDERIEITMRNEGKSLKADTIAKILKPFALDENVMNHSKGNGLGLSVVQALLRRLGSELTVNTPKGKFEVTFRLPSA